MKIWGDHSLKMTWTSKEATTGRHRAGDSRTTTRHLGRKVRLDSQETITSSAWTETRIRRHPRETETRSFWIKEALNCPFRSRASLEAWTNCRETQWATLEAEIHQTGNKWCNPIWCKLRDLISTSTLRIREKENVQWQTAILAWETLLETAMRTRLPILWIDSVQRSVWVKTSTMSSRVHRATVAMVVTDMAAILHRITNSRLSTTSSSRRNSITTRWWVRIPKTVSRCWTKEEEVVSRTSCSPTSNSKTMQATAMLERSNNSLAKGWDKVRNL